MRSKRCNSAYARKTAMDNMAVVIRGVLGVMPDLHSCLLEWVFAMPGVGMEVPALRDARMFLGRRLPSPVVQHVMAFVQPEVRGKGWTTGFSRPCGGGAGGGGEGPLTGSVRRHAALPASVT